MDPSRTLITFLFQTEPEVQTVQLFGSWDNFADSFPMERDLRRGKGEWKGCYTFKDVAASDPRTGGLEMGATYYYYYEVDGSIETFDANMPSTTTCPYLPGQAVNTLTVPTQRSVVHRSASLNSMRISDYKTMDPEAKFLPLRPSQQAPSEAINIGKRSAPALRSTASTQSFSASPTWRRLFSSKARDDDRGRSPERPGHRMNSPSIFTIEDCGASVTSTRTARSMSPESLRRFLSDDAPPRPSSNLSERPTLVIPDEMDEDIDDDDDFAISAVSETQPFPTRLSPPPYQRLSSSTFTAPLTTANLSSLTLNTMRPTSRQQSSHSEDMLQPSQSSSTALTSAGSSALASPLSVIPPEDDLSTFYEESNRDDEETLDKHQTAGSSYVGYRLPENEGETQCSKKPRPTFKTELRTNDSLSVPVAENNYVISPIAAGFGIDDFVSELGWYVDTMGSKPE